MSAPKLGSGERFRKLSGTLAARGASNPDALAAWIGRRKYGAKKMGALSHHSHANDLSYLDLADSERGDRTEDTDVDGGGGKLECPNCGYRSDNADFQIRDGASGTSDPDAPDELRTPAPPTGYVRSGAATEVRGGGGAPGLANRPRRAVELARRSPVAGPGDIIVSRSPDGHAVIRHRAGGVEIGTIKHTERGWVAAAGGRDLAPRTHQRAALMDLVGTYNGAVTTPFHPASAPLQPPPVQTPLMQQYGVPAIRALATPSRGTADGGRVTLASAPDNDDGTDDNGLNAKGQGIYKKLLAKGFPAARALAFAKRSQNVKAGQFGQAAS